MTGCHRGSGGPHCDAAPALAFKLTANCPYSTRPLPAHACRSTPDDAAMCYICYDEANEDDHQLIRSPCACQTIVHKRCLAQWIESKHSHECSICKASLPPGVTTPAPYIMLQVTRHMRGLDWTGPREFTLSFQGTERDMLIGSGTADVRMPDPSMSRQHAWLRFRDGHFELEDAGSSSGSYKLVRQTCCLERGAQQQFKIGRTQLSLHIARAGRESSSSAECSVACEEEDAAAAAAAANRLLHDVPTRAPVPAMPGTPAHSMFTVTPATSVGDFEDE